MDEAMELEPCPFCDSPAERAPQRRKGWMAKWRYGRRDVSCSNPNCGAHMTYFSEAEWNRRTQAQAIEELRRENERHSEAHERMADRLDIRQDECGTFYDKIDSLTAAVHNAEFDLERMTEDRDRLRRERDEAREEAEKAKKHFRLSTKVQEEYEADNAALRTQVADLTRQRDEARNRLRQLQARFDGYKAKTRESKQ